MRRLIAKAATTATTFDGLRADRSAFACKWYAVCVLLCAAPVAHEAFAQHKSAPEGTVRKNWYGDPFFALSAAGPACPTPLGPRMTRAQADDDAHYRVERGTSCWLAHRCSKPNSYLYDADIATAVRKQLHDAPLLAGARLWITVQRRFVYADGCVPAGFDRLALQRRLEEIQDVERVFVRVTSDPRALLPYPTSAAPR
jgi:hypothetical protein